jgi:hypothetical protein
VDKPTVGDFISELHKFADALSKLNVNSGVLDDDAIHQFVSIKAMRMMIEGAVLGIEKEKNERKADREAPQTTEGV